MYACLCDYNSETGGAIISKFQGSSGVPRDGIKRKNGKWEVIGRA